MTNGPLSTPGDPSDSASEEKHGWYKAPQPPTSKTGYTASLTRLQVPASTIESSEYYTLACGLLQGNLAIHSCKIKYAQYTPK